MGKGIYLADTNLAYNGFSRPLGVSDGPPEVGAESGTMPFLGPFLLGGSHGTKEIRGGASSSSTTAQGKATAKMADRLRVFHSRVSFVGYGSPFSLLFCLLTSCFVLMFTFCKGLTT